jgi:RHS repeat-associated protein
LLFLLVALRSRTGLAISLRYFVLDHLGSVSVVTDETGAVTERLSYDAWGRHRHGADWTDDPTCSSGSATTTRGFTGQEEMDSVRDVNLNARVYDPTIGRFLSPDSVTETAYDLQVLNRYSYVGNNPLSYSDPSGHCFLGCFWSSGIFRAVVAIAAAATLQAELADAELAASTTAELSPQLAVLNVGISGGVSGYITTGRLNGALLGSLEGVAFAGVHLHSVIMTRRQVLKCCSLFPEHSFPQTAPCASPSLPSINRHSSPIAARPEGCGRR